MLPWVSRRRHRLECEVERTERARRSRDYWKKTAKVWKQERDETRGERDAALSRVVELEQAIRTVLRDEETGAGGWGPDVTMANVLRSALEGE